ncbi:hypothetical protein T484DRAFT_1786397 [Baffinella frigidus]|nr:hypothetical protein T484DRAFT_1786397 [Cryptophyta sp. CCMP2293]
MPTTTPSIAAQGAAEPCSPGTANQDHSAANGGSQPPHQAVTAPESAPAATRRPFDELDDGAVGAAAGGDAKRARVEGWGAGAGGGQAAPRMGGSASLDRGGGAPSEGGGAPRQEVSLAEDPGTLAIARLSAEVETLTGQRRDADARSDRRAEPAQSRESLKEMEIRSARLRAEVEQYKESITEMETRSARLSAELEDRRAVPETMEEESRRLTNRRRREEHAEIRVKHEEALEAVWSDAQRVTEWRRVKHEEVVEAVWSDAHLMINDFDFLDSFARDE